MDLSLKQLAELEPADLIQARAQALERAEFRFIYASYHPDSNFRHNFQCCNDYLRHAHTEKSVAPQIDECKVLVEDIEAESAQVLYRMQITLEDGTEAGYYEVAELKCDNGGWRYLRGYKVPLQELDSLSAEYISCELIIQRGTCF
ncbi:MAG: YchJ family metal-binding protein [Desulfuromonadaceae bacterium]